MEIMLRVEWTTEDREDALPTAAMRKDPLLWPIWTLRTGWVYKVILKREPGASEEWQEFTSEKKALAEYKLLVKREFPRSKEVDYGFPLDDTPSG